MVLLVACSSSNKQAGYEMLTYSLGTDCELYVMHFDDGDLFERIALSGYCTELTDDIYFDGVQRHLDSINFDTAKAKGKIVFEFYDSNDEENLIQRLTSLFPDADLLLQSETNLTLKLAE